MSYLHNLFRGDSSPRVHRVGKCVCTFLQSFQNRRNSKPLLNFPPHLVQLSVRYCSRTRNQSAPIKLGIRQFYLVCGFPKQMTRRVSVLTIRRDHRVWGSGSGFGRTYAHYGSLPAINLGTSAGITTNLLKVVLRYLGPGWGGMVTGPRPRLITHMTFFGLGA